MVISVVVLLFIIVPKNELFPITCFSRSREGNGKKIGQKSGEELRKRSRVEINFDIFQGYPPSFLPKVFVN